MTISSDIEPVVAYFAHPVGDPDPAVVARNIAEARAFLGLLILACPDVAWQAPWLPYLDVLREDGEGGPNRARGMRDNRACVRRCDVLVMVGRTPGGSKGMRDEAGAASDTLDCTGLEVGEVAEIVNAFASGEGAS